MTLHPRVDACRARRPRRRLPVLACGRGRHCFLSIHNPAGFLAAARAAELDVAGALRGLSPARLALHDHDVVSRPRAVDEVHEVVAVLLSEGFGLRPRRVVLLGDHALPDKLRPGDAFRQDLPDRLVVQGMRLSVPREPVAGPADRLSYGVLVEDVLQPVMRLRAAGPARREQISVLAVLPLRVVRLGQFQASLQEDFVELVIAEFHMCAFLAYRIPSSENASTALLAQARPTTRGRSPAMDDLASASA